LTLPKIHLPNLQATHEKLSDFSSNHAGEVAMIDIQTLVVWDVENAARWRRHKAEGFPHDADRNITAADILDRIAVELKGLKGSFLHGRAAKLAGEDRNEAFPAAVSCLTRAIGFRSDINGAQEFLTVLCSLVEPS
jgi:hypothetical protein